MSTAKTDYCAILRDSMTKLVAAIISATDAFADLYIQMTKDIGCEDVVVEIDTEIIGLGARINVKFKM